DPASREPSAKNEARRRGQDDEREYQGEDLVAHGAVRVEPDHDRGAEHAEGQRARTRAPPVEPILERRERAEPAIQETLHILGAPRPAGPQPRDGLRRISFVGAPRPAGPQPRDGLRRISFVGAPRPAGPQPRDGLRRTKPFTPASELWRG